MRAPLADRPIVIIEDSDEDFEVTTWALRHAGVTNPVHRCATQGDIAELLTDPDFWPHALTQAFPILMLFDLNIPGTDFMETLNALRTNHWWRSVPIVVVSTSVQPASVAICYRAGVAGFLHKTLDLDTFAVRIQRLTDYWLDAVVPPVAPGEAEAPPKTIGIAW